MPLVLRVPGRSLGAEFTTGRVLSGPSDAGPVRAYFAHHGSDWYVFPLTHFGVVQHNGAPLAYGTRVGFGDELSLGRLTVGVEEATVDAPVPLAPGDCRTVCRVDVAGLGQAIVDDDLALIGSGTQCVVEVPGAPDVLAALARVCDRWVLYDVSPQPPGRLPPAGVPLRDGDAVRVGPVSFEFEIFPEDELPAVGLPTDTASGLEMSAGDTVTQLPAPLPAPAVVDPVRLPAQHLCRWVQIAHQVPANLPAVPVPPAPDGATPLLELAALAVRVGRDPHDKVIVGRLAEFVRARGYADLYRLMLRRVFHLDQADPYAAAALAEAYLDAGRDPAVDPAERRKRLAEAARFAAHAESLRGSDPALAALRRTVSVEQTTLFLRPLAAGLGDGA